MIARMEKLFLVGPKRLAPAVLLRLQQAGVVQIDTLRTDVMARYRLSPEQEVQLKGWEGAATSADHALRLLGLETDPSVESFGGELEEAGAMISSWERRAADLVEMRERLREELEMIGQYREIAALLAETVQGLDESAWLTVLPLFLDRQEDLPALEKELASAFDGRFLLAERPVHGRLTVVIVVLKRDAEEAKGILSHQGLSELPRTGEYSGMSLRSMASHLAERSRSAPEELAAIEEALGRLAGEAGRMLKGLWNRAKDESMRLHTFREMASGRYGFALFGWVPVHLEDRVRGVMIPFEGQTQWMFEPPEDREAVQVPVMLHNPAWVRPFESLISFLNMPRYDARDPTWVVAVFFPLWFGMIVGDIGYGMVFAAAGWYLSRYVRRRRTLVVDFFKVRIPPAGVAQVVRILKPMVGWTILWGLLYGECFGDLLQRIGVFGSAKEPGLVPILIPRTDTIATANGLILLSIGFGVYQVLYGFYLKAMQTHGRGEKKHFWEAGGYFCGVAALVLFAYAFMAGDFRLWLLIPVAAGAAAFLVGMLRAGMPLMIAELPTQGGHILSYIRIYAVGLASAILANLATDIGFSLCHLLGVAGLVVGTLAGLLTALLIHALLLALLTVSHVLQPIRLIWVEFFTKFDFYTTSGRPYRPFRSIRGASRFEWLDSRSIASSQTGRKP